VVADANGPRASPDSGCPLGWESLLGDPSRKLALQGQRWFRRPGIPDGDGRRDAMLNRRKRLAIGAAAARREHYRRLARSQLAEESVTPGV